MKLITLFVVMTILLPSGISISENNKYIKISDYNYSINISKFYPMVIINDSKGSFIFALTRIITSEGDNYQLFLGKGIPGKGICKCYTFILNSAAKDNTEFYC